MATKPSRGFRKSFDRVFEQEDEDQGTADTIALGQSIKEGLQTPFGAALYQAIEDVERSAYAAILTTSAWRVDKQQEYRAELRAVLYLKARLDSYITNADALASNIQNLNVAWDEE